MGLDLRRLTSAATVAVEGLVEAAVVFGPAEAAVAATLYGRVGRPRGREVDLTVAACALIAGAALWTLNRDDFHDIPDLRFS